MTELVLHLGAHKTASSLIQSTLRVPHTHDPELSAFVSNGCAYIDVASSDFAEFRKDYFPATAPKVTSQVRPDENSLLAAARVTLHRLIEKNKSSERILYSNENTPGFLSPARPQLFPLREEVNYVFSGLPNVRVKIVIYIREQASWLSSWYSQYSTLKECRDRYGDTLGFLDFINAIELERLLWLDVADYFAERVDAVELVPFETIKDVGSQEFVDEFSRRFYSGEVFPVGPHSHTREGLSARKLAILHEAKRYMTGPELGLLEVFLGNTIEPRDVDEKIKLPGLFADAMKRHCARSNEAAFDKYVAPEFQYCFDKYYK